MGRGLNIVTTVVILPALAPKAHNSFSLYVFGAPLSCCPSTKVQAECMTEESVCRPLKRAPGFSSSLQSHRGRWNPCRFSNPDAVLVFLALVLWDGEPRVGLGPLIPKEGPLQLRYSS